MEKKEQGSEKEEQWDDLGQETQTDPGNVQPEIVEAKPSDRAPETVPVPEEAEESIEAQEPESEHVRQEDQVRVAPHLPDLLSGIAIPFEEEGRAREQRNLDEILHRLLVVGLAISVSLMLAGLFLDLFLHREVPTAVPDIGEVTTRVISLRPSGFLALGLLALIATPVLRVVGSIIAFLFERDWRYAGITFLVLLVVTLSIVLGKG